MLFGQMPPDAFYWVMGVGIPSLITFCIWLAWKIKLVNKDTADALKILQDGSLAEGQKDLVDAMKDVSKANKTLSWYIVQSVKAQTGEVLEPPPPTEL